MKIIQLDDKRGCLLDSENKIVFDFSLTYWDNAAYFITSRTPNVEVGNRFIPGVGLVDEFDRVVEGGNSNV